MAMGDPAIADVVAWAARTGIGALLSRAFTPDEHRVFMNSIKKLIEHAVKDADKAIRDINGSGLPNGKQDIANLLFQQFETEYQVNQTIPTLDELVRVFDDEELVTTVNGWRRLDERAVSAIQRELGNWLKDCDAYVDRRTDRTVLEIFGLLTKYIERPEDSTKEYNRWPRSDHMLHFAGMGRVDFFGREVEMGKLKAFCVEETKPLCWWMVAGDGGIGKSRLCLEFARKMEELDWTICYPRDRTLNGLNKCSERLPNKTLFILDYAETDATAIWDWLKRLRRDTTTIRVILIQRKTELSGVPPSEPEISDNRYNKYPLPITELDAGTFDHPGPLRKILKNYLEKNKTETHEQFKTSEQFEEAVFKSLAKIDGEIKSESKNRPLFLQIVAETLLEDFNPSQPRKLRDFLEFICNKEMHLIEISIDGSSTQGDPIIELYKIAKRIVVCATFVNGITVKKAGGSSDFEALLPEDCSKFPDEPGVWRRFFANRYLFDVSENKSVCPPLEPDIIGEYFVLKCLKDMREGGDLPEPETVSRLLDAIWDNRRKEAVAFINRVRQDHPGDYEELFEWQQGKKWDAAMAASMNKMDGINKDKQTVTFANMPWRFLDFKPAEGADPAKVLLLSENIIGLHAYDAQDVFDYDDKVKLSAKLFDQTKPTNWKKCSLQGLLNLRDGAFWQGRITDDEWNRITETHNIMLPEDGDEAAVETDDKMFLLDTEQAERYFASSESRRAWLALNSNDINETASRIYKTNRPGRTIERLTEMVKSWDINSVNEPEERKPRAHWWWLRSPGFDAHYAAFVYADGSVNHYGSYVLYALGGVRPAFWLNLQS